MTYCRYIPRTAHCPGCILWSSAKISPIRRAEKLKNFLLLDGPPLPHDIAGGLSWATSFGVYALLPSRLFMDAKTRAWLEGSKHESLRKSKRMLCISHN